MADYGTSLLLVMARQPEQLYTASGLAELSGLSIATVSKILKILNRGDLLLSHRGSQGGYRLAKPPESIALIDIVRLLDGEVAMTECEHSQGCCELEKQCETKQNWSVLSRVVNEILASISLAQMLRPLKAKEVAIKFYDKRVVE